MKLSKCIITFSLLFLLLFVCIGSVSALENQTDDSGCSEIILGVGESTEIPADGNATYSELKDEIGSGGDITLNKTSYIYDGSSDPIVITQSCTIDGNGALIDMGGSNINVFLTSNGTDVVIKNFVIKNSNANYGGAICFEGAGSAVNCTFEDNSAVCGGAIYSSTNVSVYNSIFVNNDASDYGDAIFCEFGSLSINDCWFGSNNPDWSNLICCINESFIPSSYAVLNVSSTPQTPTNSKVRLEYSFYRNATDEVIYDMPVRPIELSSDGGFLENTTGYLINGSYSVEFTSNTQGIYNITAKVDNEEIITQINVTITPTEINVNPDSLNLTVGGNDTIIANLTPDGAGNVSFSSNDENIVVVDTDGFVTAVGEGNATITVSFAGDDYYSPAQVNVTVVVSPKEKENATVDIDAPAITEGEDAGVTVTLPEDATGNVTVGNETVSLVNGTASVLISGLPVGNNTVPVTYSGDDKYNPVETNVTITVNEKPVPTKENLTLEASTEPIAVGEDVTVVVTGLENATGNVTVTVEEGIYTAPIVDGAASVVVPGLIENVTATVTYDGDDRYNNASTSVDIVINPKEKENVTVGIDAPAITEGDNATVTVTLPGDATGNITVGNETVSVVNGTASVLISDLPVGNNTVPVTYSGDDKYNPIETNVTVTVNEKPVPTKENLTIEATAEPITVGEDASVVVTGLENATGNVTVEVGDAIYSAPIVDGASNITILGLIENTTATVTYAGDDRYNNASTSVDIVVNPKEKENVTVDIDAPAIIEGDNATVTVTLPDGATGNVTIGNETVPVVDGAASVTISDLPIGNTTVPVTYSGDENYNPFETEVNVTVNENKMIVSAPGLVKYYKGPDKFVVIVTDSKGNPFANKSVDINIGGVTYSRTTGENGTTRVSINLNSGYYPVVVAVDDIKVESFINVRATILADDVVKVFRNATQYYAQFLDSNGDPLEEVAVSFNIHGVFYTRTTNENGYARLNINLNEGEYILTAINPETGEMKSNIIKVISLIESRDLTKYYRNDSQFIVRIHSADGSYVGAGEKVTFNINGVFYTRFTNATGHAKLNLNLAQGDYIVTTYYKDCSQGNKVKILPILTADDLVMRYLDGTPFTAKVVDGQGRPYANQKVEFNIEGILYYRTTGSNGLVQLNVKLQPGQYLVTSSYNGCTIANKITVLG